MILKRIKLTNAYIDTYLLENYKELSISKRPGVLVCPGGAFAFCSNRESEQVAIAFNNAGFNAFVLKYTVGKGSDAAINDGFEALDYITSHKDEFALNKIIICGFSAGAHLAAAASIYGKNKPDGMILVYPAITEFKDSYDILKGINASTPKAFIVHTFSDATVSVGQSLMLMQRLYENNIEFESHIYRAGDHGFSVANKAVSAGNPKIYDLSCSTWVSMAIRWISDAIGDIEFIKKIEKDDLPPILLKPLKEFLDNPGCVEAINRYFPNLIKDNIEKFSNFLLGMIILYTEKTTLDQINLLANEISQAIEN